MDVKAAGTGGEGTEIPFPYRPLGPTGLHFRFFSFCTSGNSLLFCECSDGLLCRKICRKNEKSCFFSNVRPLNLWDSVPPNDQSIHMSGVGGFIPPIKCTRIALLYVCYQT